LFAALEAAEAEATSMNVMKVKKSGLKALKYLQDIDRDDVLEAIGLQERRSAWAATFGSIGIFALGCLVGAGIGLAFAPKPGNELRTDLGEKVRKKAQELQENQTSAFGSTSRSQMPVT
jgi:hypothetical protein